IGNIDLPTSALVNPGLGGDAGVSATPAPDDFNAPNVFNLVAPSASQAGQFFPQSAGAIWEPLDISKDFTVHARLFFGNGVFNPFNSGGGAGITFTLQDAGAHAVGEIGSALGIGNIPGAVDAVGVKFDTSSDSQYAEPSYNFAQFFANDD